MNLTTTTAGRPGRRRGTRLALLLSVLLAAAAALAAATLTTPEIARTTIALPLGQARRAAVTIDAGVGTLQLGARAAEDALIAGAVTHPSSEQLEQELTQVDGVARYLLRSRPAGSGWTPVWLPSTEQFHWDVNLSPAILLELRIRGGVGAAQLDLSALQVDLLELRSGVGATTLSLPRQGQVRATVAGGVGDTSISIPAGVAARVAAQAGQGHVTLLVDGVPQSLPYVAPGYATAANRVDLTVKSGVGAITVRIGDQ